MTKALLLIDAQVNMFAEETAVYDAETVLNRLATLLDRARQANVPVVFVQNNGGEGDPDLPGTPGWAIHPRLTPLEGESVVQKTTPNSFHKTGLDPALKVRGINELVIAGMQTEFCVDTTTRQAAALDYKLTLVKDAHSTFDGSQLTAPQVIAYHNGLLQWFADLKAAEEIQF